MFNFTGVLLDATNQKPINTVTTTATVEAGVFWFMLFIFLVAALFAIFYIASLKETIAELKEKNKKLEEINNAKSKDKDS